MVAGLAVPTLGLRATAMYYGAVVIVLALPAGVGAAVRRRAARPLTAVAYSEELTAAAE
ncbi:hypothetical protein [Streptomyces sp. NPDC005209]|uniref:hypothetical protein n=1 Tax=Streptomyces sp. NPDC005209 TaxID=3156715 RepID=UPI0033B59289